MARLTKRVKRSKSRKSRKLHRKKIKGGQERMTYQRRVLQLLTGIGECVCKNGNFAQTTLEIKGISTQGGKKTRKLSKKLRGGVSDDNKVREVIAARFNNILKELENIRVEEIHAFARIEVLKLLAENLLEQIGNHISILESFDKKDGVDTITPTVTLLDKIQKINSDNIGDELPKILKEYEDEAVHTGVGAINDYVKVEPKGALGKVYR